MTINLDPATPLQKVIARIQQWDNRVLSRLNGSNESYLTPLLKGCSFLGREPIWLALIAWFVFIFYDIELFVHFGLDLFYGLIFIAILKRIIRRPRPSVLLPNIRVLDRPNRSFSFPSWHSYNLVAFSLSFTYLSNMPFLLVLGLGMSAIVAYSRVYLGVHYPSDVIVGYLCGVPGFLLAWATTPWWVGLVRFFESFAPFPTTEGWNYFLQAWWYWVVITGVYGGIILSGTYRMLRYKRKNGEKKEV